MKYWGLVLIFPLLYLCRKNKNKNRWIGLTCLEERIRHVSQNVLTKMSSSNVMLYVIDLKCVNCKARGGIWLLSKYQRFTLQLISCQEHILYTTPCFIFSSFITNKSHKRSKKLWWLMVHLFRRTLILTVILSQNCNYAAFTAVVVCFVIHKGTMLLSSIMYEIINVNIFQKEFFSQHFLLKQAYADGI